MNQRTFGNRCVLLLILTAFVGGCTDEVTAAPVGGLRAEPVCSGCLCLDPTWSCDADTWLAADGGVVELKPEAGFFELEEHCYGYKGEARCVEPARIWYAFQPADERPEMKPLVVFFNGSAHWAESAALFSHNTSRRTLDTKQAIEAPWADNPHSWTRFANVLYPDPRHAGFSYAIGGGTSASELPSVPLVFDHEVADNVRVILRFLERHPQLQANPIIIVAESMAGTRANWLFDMVLNYGSLLDEQARYSDQSLFDALQTHFDAVAPGAPGRILEAAEIAQQFGHQILIQPLVAGNEQLTAAEAMRPWPDCSGHEERCAEAEFQARAEQCVASVANRLLDPSVLSQMTLVDTSSVEWLLPPARADAVRYPVIPPCGDGVAEPGMDDWDFGPMVAEWGALDEEDGYYRVVVDWENLDDDDLLVPDSGYRFLSNVRHVQTFITNAALDSLIYGPSIPTALEAFDDAVSSATHDTAPRDGVARPGWMTIHYRGDWLGSSDTVREIRMPIYPESGHMVPAWQPAEILEDVQTWYEGGE